MVHKSHREARINHENLPSESGERDKSYTASGVQAHYLTGALACGT